MQCSEQLGGVREHLSAAGLAFAMQQATQRSQQQLGGDSVGVEQKGQGPRRNMSADHINVMKTQDLSHSTGVPDYSLSHSVAAMQLGSAAMPSPSQAYIPPSSQGVHSSHVFAQQQQNPYNQFNSHAAQAPKFGMVAGMMPTVPAHSVQILPQAAVPQQTKAASKERKGTVAMECKHPGCDAKLMIIGKNEKQVVGQHNHMLCQRGCWTCQNFVQVYMASNAHLQ